MRQQQKKTHKNYIFLKYFNKLYFHHVLKQNYFLLLEKLFKFYFVQKKKRNNKISNEVKINQKLKLICIAIN